MSKSIIQQLMDNEKPFGLMSEEMQHAMVCDFKKADFEYYCGPEWDNKAKDGSVSGFLHGTAYRLNPDYAEEPEIVECEIYGGRMGMLTYDRGDTFTACTITCACREPDFIGFKFSDGTVHGSPIKYSVPGITSKGYYASYDDLKTKQALEHHATHVIMRKRLDK